MVNLVLELAILAMQILNTKSAFSESAAANSANWIACSQDDIAMQGHPVHKGTSILMSRSNLYIRQDLFL